MSDRIVEAMYDLIEEMKTNRGLPENAREQLDKLDELIKLQGTEIRQRRQLNRLDRGRIRQNIEHAETIEDLIDAIDKEDKLRSRLVSTYRHYERKVDSLTRTVANTTVNLFNMGDSVTASTRVLSSMVSVIPFVGSTVASIMDQIASITEETYKSFNTVAQVGATFGGNLKELRRTVSDTGITLDQYAGVVSRSSANLAFWDGGVREGSQALAEMSSEIRDMVMRDSPLARLGYSLEATAELVANYGGITQRLSSRQLRDDRNLADAAREYAMQLSAISRLTGKSVEELQREADARMADAQFRTMAAKMDRDNAAALNAFLGTLPEGMQTAVKDILATGTATTEQGEQLMALMPGLVDQIMDMRRAIHSGEEISRDRFKDFYTAAESEADQLRESPLLDTLGLFVREFDDLVLGILDISQRTIDYREALDQMLDDLERGFEGDNLAVDIADTMARLAQSSEKLRIIFMQFSDSLRSRLEEVAENISGTAEWIIEKIVEMGDRLNEGESLGDIIWDGMSTGLTTWWNNSLESLGNIFQDFTENFRQMLRDVLPWFLTSRDNTRPDVSGMNHQEIRNELEHMQTQFSSWLIRHGNLSVDESHVGIELGKMFERFLELESALGDDAPQRPGGLEFWLDEYSNDSREDNSFDNDVRDLKDNIKSIVEILKEQGVDLSSFRTRIENLENIGDTTDPEFNAATNLLRDLENLAKYHDIKIERRSGSLGETGSLMEDFGSGTPVMLHGRESVVTLDQMENLARGFTMAMQRPIHIQSPIESGDFLRDLTSNLARFKIDPQEFAEQIKKAVPDADINIQATAQQEPDTTATAQAAMTTEQFNKMNRNLEIIAQLLGRQLDVEQRTLTATQDNVRDSFFAT